MLLWLSVFSFIIISLAIIVGMNIIREPIEQTFNFRSLSLLHVSQYIILYGR